MQKKSRFKSLDVNIAGRSSALLMGGLIALVSGLVVFVAIVYTQVAFAQAVSVQPAAASKPATPAAPPVAAQPSTAAPQEAIRVLMIPAAETSLVAPMVGRIDRLGVQLGSTFRAGQPLVAFDCSENDAKLRMAQAEFASAKEQLDAKLRLQTLNAAGEVEVQLATSAAERAKAQISVNQTFSRQCRVDAPFAGRVVKIHVKQFQGVNVGQAMIDIVSSGPLKVRLNAPSRWLQWMKVGTPFEVVIDETGKAYPANIAAINGRVDAVSQSIELEAQVRGAYPELLAGMSGNARFTVPR
jgi:membrane fusion protein, multidrug efflux system